MTYSIHIFGASGSGSGTTTPGLALAERLGIALRRHETWIKTLNCPVIRVDSTGRSVEELVRQVLDKLHHSIFA